MSEKEAKLRLCCTLMRWNDSLLRLGLKLIDRLPFPLMGRLLDSDLNGIEMQDPLRSNEAAFQLDGLLSFMLNSKDAVDVKYIQFFLPQEHIQNMGDFLTHFGLQQEYEPKLENSTRSIPGTNGNLYTGIVDETKIPPILTVECIVELQDNAGAVMKDMAEANRAVGKSLKHVLGDRIYQVEILEVDLLANKTTFRAWINISDFPCLAQVPSINVSIAGSDCQATLRWSEPGWATSIKESLVQPTPQPHSLPSENAEEDNAERKSIQLTFVTARRTTGMVVI